MEIQGIGPLYKQTETGLLDWQAWTHLGSASINCGRVGERGGESIHRFQDERTALAELEAAASAKRIEGYGEIPPEEHFQIVIRWQSECWASTSDLPWRHEVEDIVDDALSATGLGMCDGGSFGGHRVEVYCLVVDRELGVREILNVLQELERLEGAVLSVREGDEYRVIFPEP